ncbi:protein FAF-like, chloroplastic [Humulus lupulus]|uniref:protein FAF-like, chloroplastic n=1 Tax=Humulus lupulus TaxID=3486 RepID=UPI002B406926|nr:protein FAF-like, chloroplastic [Humulus lupulus]
MSGSLSKSLGLSSSFMKIVEQECPASLTNGGGKGKQGIAVAILGSEDYCERNRAGAGASLRRTLSADMSSKTWLAQNGLVSPMKKIASSKELVSIPARRLDSFSSSEDEEEDQEYDQEENKEEQNQGEYDIWSLIISQKAKEESKSASTPYVHPLVKSRASSLSENSLQICTESLGSETGSDGFSSYPSSLTGDSSELDKGTQEEEEKTQLGQSVSTKFNNSATVPRKSVTPTRSFPPPLPSLTGDGAMKVRMQTRRDNGRLVVEAVSVPSQKNYFAAQRQDGRLVLTFAKGSSTDVTADHNSLDQDLENEVETEDWELNEEGEFEEQFGSLDDETESLDKDDDDDDEDEDNHYDDDDEEEKIYGVTEESFNIVPTRLINVHRLASMMNKPVGLANRNPATTPWSKKLNEDNDQDQDQKISAQTTLAQSLPPRPRPTVGRLIASPPTKGATATSIGGAAASFNAYEYFWRRSNPNPINSIYNNKFMSSTTVSSLKSQNPNDNRHRQEPQMLVLRGNKGEYLVSTLKGCKEPRRTLFWEPYCIATSS